MNNFKNDNEYSTGSFNILQNKFIMQELKARFLACYIWSVILGTCVSMLFIFLQGIGACSPLQWIFNFVSNTCSLLFGFQIFTLLLFAGLILHLLWKYISVEDTVYQFRHELLQSHFLCYDKLVTLLLISAAGMFLGLSTSLLYWHVDNQASQGFVSTINEDVVSNDNKMISENNWIRRQEGILSCVLCGAFVALLCGVQIFFYDVCVVRFLDEADDLSINPVHKFTSQIGAVFSLKSVCYRNAARTFVYFMLLYSVVLRGTVMQFLHKAFGNQVSESSGLFSLFFNISLLWRIFGLILMLQCTVQCLVIMFNFFMSKSLKLPLKGAPLHENDLSVVSILELDSNLCHATANNQVDRFMKTKYLRLLVIKRLKEIVCDCDITTSSTKLMPIFELTHLGGYARTWNTVYGHCRFELQCFLQHIHNCNASLLKKKGVNSLSTFTGSRGSLNSCDKFLSPLSFGNSPTTVLLSRKQSAAHDTTISTYNNGTLAGSGRASFSATNNKQYVNDSCNDFLSCMKSKIFDYLRHNTLYAYITSPLPQYATLLLFTGRLSSLWCAQVLCTLTCASYTLDIYGNVQADLADILSLYVSLYEAIERHLKLSGHGGIGGSMTANCNVGEGVPASFLCFDISGGVGIGGVSSITTGGNADMVWKLRSVLSNCLRCLVATFGKHLNNIAISKETLLCLETFINMSGPAGK